MKLFSAQKSLQKGFTLIELLVVIGILGILAAALVATIDPFEQLKKADDSKIKNIAVEFQTSLVRYYTTHGAFPWSDADNANAECTALGGANIVAMPLADPATGANAMTDCIADNLINEGELKDAFDSNLTDLSKVYVTWDTTDASDTVICFAPTSKSQKAAPDAAYDADGGDYSGSGTCPDADADDGECHWCTR